MEKKIKAAIRNIERAKKEATINALNSKNEMDKTGWEREAYEDGIRLGILRALLEN